MSQHLSGGIRENSGENRNQRSRILGYMESSSPINVQRPLTGLGVMSDRVLTQRNTNTAATSVQQNMHEDYDMDDNCQESKQQATKKQIYEQRIKGQEDKITKLQASDDSRLKQIKENMNKLVETIQNETMSRDIMDEKKTKEIKLTENNLQIELNIEKQHRRETEAKISKIVDERLYTIRLDLAKEKKIREETQAHSTLNFGDQLQSLHEHILNEQQ